MGPICGSTVGSTCGTCVVEVPWVLWWGPLVEPTSPGPMSPIVEPTCGTITFAKIDVVLCESDADRVRIDFMEVYIFFEKVVDPAYNSCGAYRKWNLFVGPMGP